MQSFERKFVKKTMKTPGKLLTQSDYRNNYYFPISIHSQMQLWTSIPLSRGIWTSTWLNYSKFLIWGVFKIIDQFHNSIWQFLPIKETQFLYIPPFYDLLLTLYNTSSIQLNAQRYNRRNAILLLLHQKLFSFEWSIIYFLSQRKNKTT